MLHFPNAYLRSLHIAVHLFDSAAVWPRSENVHNFLSLLEYTHSFNRLFLGQFGAGGTLWVLVVFVPAALFFGIIGVSAALITRTAQPRTAALLVATAICLYYLGGLALLTSGDFARYRTEIDPLLLALVAVMVCSTARRLAGGLRSSITRLFPYFKTLG